MTQIYIFGDSSVYGYGDEKGGWAQRLREFLDKKTLGERNNFYALVYNIGISGNTSEDLLERFEFDTKQRQKDAAKKEEIIFIFCIGKNDCTFLKNKNSFWISPDRYKENLEKLIEKARKFSPKIIFVGLEPFDDSRTNPASFSRNHFYKTENVEKYNKILKSVCQNKEVYLIETFDKFKETDYRKLLLDGVHPNSKGHQKIFEIVRDFLLEKKLI